MTEQTPILSVQGLCAGYRGHTVLRDISFALAPGEILCVAGESGCGKSTLLRALMGADDAAEVTAGTVILAGREPMALPRRQRQRYRCRHMGMIFQNPGASFDPVRSYGAQFRDTLKSHGRYDARRFAADAEEALGRLGLTDPCRLLACRPYELSGGMNQRMAMALALLLGQQVLLADYLVQSAGTQPVGKRRGHGRPSFSGSDTSIVPDFCRKVNRFFGKEPLTAVLQ